MTGHFKNSAREKIESIYMSYPIVAHLSVEYINTPNKVYIFWLSIMGLQETVNLMEGIDVNDMRRHPKNHS